MVETKKQPVRPTWSAIKKRPPNARTDERGLTTLEWLLIVAAVAGLAALAVVLVQNVVSETAEQIAGSSARKTAAEVAALNLEEEAKLATVSEFLEAEGVAQTTAEATAAWGKWDNHFTSKCNTIGIVFSDADVTIDAGFARPTTAGNFTAVILLTGLEEATATEPQVKCNVA